MGCIPPWRIGVRVLLLALLAAGPLGAVALDYATAVRPLLEAACHDCHGAARRKGGVDLQRFADRRAVEGDLKLWRRVGEMIATGEMPPEDAKVQLDTTQKELLLGWIAGLSYTGPVDPGSVTIRRLNRNEYKNTIRDLLGMEATPADAFPSDEVGYGFDNIGDVLSIPPLLMEKYLAAAAEILDEAIVYEQLRLRVPAEDLDVHVDDKKVQTVMDEKEKAVALAKIGTVSVQLGFPVEGKYTIEAKVGAFQLGEEGAVFQLLLDKRTLEEFQVTSRSGSAKTFKTTVEAKPGTYRVAVRFVNPSSLEHQGTTYHRALHVREIEVTGPRASRIPTSHRRIMVAKPSARVEPREAAMHILTIFTRRAYRRPVAEAEVERLLKLWDLAVAKGLPFEDCVRLSLQAVLISPHFLFRIELDPQGDGSGRTRALGGHELANRLSYFLWCSMPDDKLFAAAEGSLGKDDELLAETRRLIADRKVRGFVESFVGQWLQLRNLATIEPDPEAFPGVTERLKEAMAEEAYALFEHVLREDRPITELLDADYTFVNSLLAQHYGIDGVMGLRMQQVPVGDGVRGGILAMAGVMMTTSTPTRTNPPRRGKFVLEQIVGDPPPPPPPNVEDLPEEQGRAKGLTLREMLELHRQRADCMNCHQRLDPIGFGLENFDAVGRWRDRDNGKRLDAGGTLPSGESFTTPRQLARIFSGARRDQFARTLTEKLLVFALGRGLEAFDEPTVDAIVADLQQRDYRISAIIEGIVLSHPFRHSRR